MQLAHRLREAGIALDDPRIIATTGWTTDELSAALDAVEPLGHDWALVSLLIGVLTRTKTHDMADLPSHPVMQRWWAHMADIMQTNPDNSPWTIDLKPVFHMP